ncbi:MAG: HK97 gp10 family phage protein [Pseudomonadota bacterium]
MSLTGMREWEARLKAIPEAMKQAAQTAIDQNAEELVTAMKATVPKRTGTLESTIRSEPLDGGRIGRVIMAGGVKTTKVVRNSEKGNAPTFDYALAAEFGKDGRPGANFFYGNYRLRRRRIRGRLTRAINKAAKLGRS